IRFWERAACENIPIVEHWNQRVRKSLKTRYDYRDGVFDWDYHMILKSRNILNLTLQEYRFWRSNGVAFTWLEGEPVRSNPTLLSNIIQYGPASVHCGYLGDITNAHNMTEHLPNFIPLLKKGAIVLIELKKNLVELREEDLFNFVKELKSCAQKNGLREIGDINVKKHCIAKFCK
ncbi:Dynein assembly factor 3, axonemal like protein, partial [Dufourea novaeangliae]